MSLRQFLLRSFVFLLLFIVFDFGLGKGFKLLFTKVQSGTLFTSRYGFKESEDKILIFGGSEVAHSFISNQIADSLGMSCYNLGMDGFNVYYHYALLQEVLRRYKPACIIISSGIGGEDGEAIAGLLPYYNDYPDVQKLILDIDKSMRFKLIVNSYKYNSLIIKLIQGIIINEPKTNGYVPFYSKSNFLRLDTVIGRFGSYEKAMGYFGKMVSLAANSGAMVFVVDIPMYQIDVEYVKDENLWEPFTLKNVRFISFINDTTFLNNPSYFKDRPHLNDNGAKVFTGMIIDSLKLYMKTGVSHEMRSLH